MMQIPKRGSKKYYEWLRFQLIEGGLTCRDIARLYKLCEATIKKDAKRAGIKNVWRERTAQWYAMRTQNPYLLDREWLIEQLKIQSRTKLAEKLGISQEFLDHQLLRLGLDPEKFPAPPSSRFVPPKRRIMVHCDNCGKEFEIILSQFKKFRHHFCSRRCWREYLRKK